MYNIAQYINRKEKKTNSGKIIENLELVKQKGTNFRNKKLKTSKENNALLL